MLVTPSSVTSIRYYAFSGCSSLTQITIPSSVEKIRYYAFSRCLSLTQITIPSSVTSIGKYSFYKCSKLEQITIPSSVTLISNYSFCGCSSLTQITIPSSVTSIKENAFSGCLSLTQIAIPPSVTSIEWNTLDRCSSLTQIAIPSYAFDHQKKICKKCINNDPKQRPQMLEISDMLSKYNYKVRNSIFFQEKMQKYIDCLSNKNDIKAQYELGLTYFILGNINKAIEYFTLAESQNYWLIQARQIYLKDAYY